MGYENQLQLLRETFQKCRVASALIDPNDNLNTILDESFQLLFGDKFQLNTQQLFRDIRPETVFRLTSNLRLCFVLLRLPRTAQETILIIGPYLSDMPKPRQIMEIGEKFGVSPYQQRQLETYYGSIPVITESSHLFVLLETFCEHLWGSSGFASVEVNESFSAEGFTLSNPQSNDRDQVLLNMKMMEKRYAAENEMMQAVARGQTHKITTILESFSTIAFEKRLDDPLRNFKNYSIIMNTLLRKAAENGGVHPLYLNDISTAFAVRIERTTGINEIQELMTEMFRSYCQLVRKHTIKGYSTPVQKTILTIEADLSGDLSLSTLAATQNISAAYLSTLFKKETGKTVTDYVNSRRMQYASHLLTTTRLQIQTIALHCGILDVQYFSKVFKKYTGKTPKEFRETAK
ncbi:MAG: helix-turn-helix domain-containing protein [Clostridia bacterium]|nr:helix-turn-helix domain-containing protein [Clostridia bacterium]